MNVSLTKKVILTKSEAKNADKYIVIFPSLTRNFNGNALIKKKLKNHKNYTHVASFFLILYEPISRQSRKKMEFSYCYSCPRRRNGKFQSIQIRF